MTSHLPSVAPWTTEPRATCHRRVSAEALVTALALPAARYPTRSVVAIDGRSGSGKTTIADELARIVPSAAIVRTDDVAWNESFFRWGSIMAHDIVGPARRGERVCFRPKAWETHQRPGQIEIATDAALLIVEGVGAGRRELAALLDAIVWTQCNPHIAYRRVIDRDGRAPTVARLRREWAIAERAFLEEDRPWSRASLVVCTDQRAWPATRPIFGIADGPLGPTTCPDGPVAAAAAADRSLDRRSAAEFNRTRLAAWNLCIEDRRSQERHRCARRAAVR